jgi:hypothetical protein
MKFLKCLICSGMIEIIDRHFCVSKTVKCKNCGFSNGNEKKEPEIIVMRKISLNNE